MNEDLDSTSEHEEWFEGGRRSVYKERLLAVEDFLFFSLYSFSCIATIVQLWKNISILVFVPVPPYALPA
jgi:hypothetical protein